MVILVMLTSPRNPKAHPGHASQLLQLLGAQAGQHALLQILLAMGVHCSSLLLPCRFPLLRHVVLPQLLQELILDHTSNAHIQMPICRCNFAPAGPMWKASNTAVAI